MSKTAIEYLADELRSGKIPQESKELFDSLVFLFGSEEKAMKAILAEESEQPIRDEQCVMDDPEVRPDADEAIEQESKTPGKSKADKDKFEKILETTGKVYSEALRSLAEGEPGDH